MGVFDLVGDLLAEVEGIAFPGLPLAGGRFTLVGELERDAEGLALGVPDFLDETGRRDDDEAMAAAGSAICRVGLAFEVTGTFVIVATSLCALTWLLGACGLLGPSVPSVGVWAALYQSVGDAGSMSGSDMLRWWGRIRPTPDSDVLRGLSPSMPYPALMEST